ncbi:heme ABC transporter ATP-binding protein [Nocardioides sp. zg-579]|uniref:Heme ABC transporter ATP-binding protein n=1 Tax=Nocardioides marmotae TaxID=2663857 RepID=A0A6I3J9W9_9ACTN|nr:heme ABC transporter ATP-binding protein [Nocardioides marmotae]MCR6031351.1 heme ABC transporter ATP-binding protein [Gordonia jinghuaiqii]MTB94990.1 heme ABC transporter ATP-binding protein [Nocardioides marmotae]QKE02506.1 heme ABC transporter ATP-binding protein [Nocardioides marmotae]
MTTTGTTTTGTITISARGVGVSVEGHRILEGVDVDVRPGELLALVGPNGAGKSTLLGVLAGDTAPTTGTVELAGRELRRHPARELARLRAVQLQKQGLAFGFRVEDVVRMGRSPWHRTPAEDDDDRAVAEAMAAAEVTALAQRLFPTLSGGEQARTSFARLLAQSAPVLMLDEPTAALDIRHQEAVLDVLRRTVRAGAAVVVVLHDLSLAAAYADRVCVLADGRVRADGPPAEVLTGALLSEVYGHPVDVVEHAGHLVVVPVRTHAPPAAPTTAPQPHHPHPSYQEIP